VDTSTVRPHMISLALVSVASIMADYKFITIWRFKSPQEKVWDLIFHSENWPEWGPARS
jgi:hypothetical protein